MKRFAALILLLAMLLTLFPAASAAGGAPQEITAEAYAAVDALWAQLEQTEAAEPMGIGTRSAAAVAAAVQKSDLYLGGSLRWNGEDHFTFETTVGVTCGYSARLRKQTADARQDAIAMAQPETVSISYARRGTASSVDVYLIEPYYGLDLSFTQQYQTEAQTLAQAMGGTYHLYTRSAATIDAVADALEQGGVVIFDSHGETDYYVYDGTDTGDCTSGATTSYILLHSREGLTDADFAFDNGVYHAVDYGRTADGMYLYAVDGTVIANHMDAQAPNSLLWSATCFGMATDGLHAPLMEKGVAVAYGYTQAVTFRYDYQWEEAFFEEMRDGSTVAEAISVMKGKVGYWDLREYYPTVDAAVADHCAFPIVVSAEDVYPGRDHADALQTVNSLWTLPLYTLTVTVNDETLGSYTRKGNTVTPVPAEGAKLSGWTLTPADAAAVTATEETIEVTDLTADCVLTLEFVAKTAATVHYIVPEGVQKTTDTGYLGDTIALTAPEGSPTADAEAYTFCGWTREPVEDSLTLPEILTDTLTLTETETTLYALYSYTEKGTAVYTTLLRQKVCYAAQFTDVDLSKWYHEDIDFAVGEGYMVGYPDSTFQPNGTLTRAMLVSVLYRLSGGSGDYSHPFTDVKETAWYADAVAWAYENHVVAGMTDTTFCPNDPITREQTAAILYRYAELMGVDTSKQTELSAFADADRCASYALKAMQWVTAEGIISGIPGTGDTLLLQPKGQATRAQVAAILHRYCKTAGLI